MFEFIQQVLSQSPILQGGVSLMIAGWLGYQLRSLPERAVSLFRLLTTRVVQVREHHPHYDAWLNALTESAVRRGGPRTMEIRAQRDENGEPVAHWLAAGADVFWACLFGTWCRAHVHLEDRVNNRSLSPRYMLTIELWLCGRARLERIVARVAQRAIPPEHRQLVDLYDRHGCCTTIRIPKRDPATLCLPDGTFGAIESRLREFCGAQTQYERAGVPWRFGVLLSGRPGTGKTSLAHALASHLGLRLAVIPLNDLQCDREMVDAFRAVTEQAIILLEDIDCAFSQRSGGEGAPGVSFSGFLNCIDGVLAPHNGRILIMTTNHVDRLDPALIRPGRVDLHAQITTLVRQDAANYADRVFPNVATRHAVIDEIMNEEHPTPASLISRLTQERWRRTADVRSGVALASCQRVPRASTLAGCACVGACRTCGSEDAPADLIA